MNFDKKTIRWVTDFWALKNQHFLCWPKFLQRTLMLIGFILFYTGLTQWMNEKSQEIEIYTRQIESLTKKINTQKSTIQKYLLNDASEEMDGKKDESSNLASFLNNMSILSKQYHLEMVSIKPLPQKEEKEEKIAFNVQSIKINLIGEYPDLFRLIHHIATQSTWINIGDFEITNALKNKLNLAIVIDLYENA